MSRKIVTIAPGKPNVAIGPLVSCDCFNCSQHSLAVVHLGNKETPDGARLCPATNYGDRSLGRCRYRDTV